MTHQMPSNFVTRGSSLASFAVNNGTLLTAAYSIANATPTNTTNAPVKSEGMKVRNIVFVVVHTLFFLLAAFGNITVVVVRLKKFMQHGLSAYKQLICHLSVADTIFATFLPLDIYKRFNNEDWVQNVIVCKLLKTTQSAALTASIGILTVMAWERYQGISNPLRHRWSTKKVFLLLVAIWGYSYVNFIPYTIALEVHNGFCSDYKYPLPEFGKWYQLYQFLSTWLLPVILIALFQIRMVFKLVAHRKTIRGSTYRASAIADCSGQDGGRRPKRKMVKILVVIVTLFVILTLPIHIWHLLHEFTDRSDSQKAGKDVLEIFASLVFMHSAVNPIIYSIMDRSFREDVKRMLCLRSQKKESLLLRAGRRTTKKTF